MSARSFMQQQMLQLHSKYGLSDNAKKILRALDDFRCGRLDETELGRLVRLSKGMRTAITDTIARCAGLMEKKPKEMKNLVEIIRNCTEVLAIADQPPALQQFPFMRLPNELRAQLYKTVLRQSITTASVIAYPKKSDCRCASHGSSSSGAGGYKRVDIPLARTSKRVREELLATFYADYTFSFACGCDMLANLEANRRLAHSVRHLKIHWTGPRSDKAFAMMAKKCYSLKNLVVVISRSTTVYPTPREAELRGYFASSRPVRLIDALGIDELLQIRGLEHVAVAHLGTKQGFRRTEEDKACLQALLWSKLKLPGEDDLYSDQDDEQASP